LRRTSERVTHLSVGRNIDKRLARLESTLGIYEQAGLVITSRLHVALPCIALKTPFIFLSHFFEALDERGTNNSFNLYQSSGSWKVLAGDAPVYFPWSLTLKKDLCRNFKMI
jgi:hypothetical protein